MLMHFDTGMGVADSFSRRQDLKPVRTEPYNVIPTDGTVVLKAKDLVIDQARVKLPV